MNGHARDRGEEDGSGGSTEQQSATRRHRVTAPRPDLPARFRAPTIRTTAAEAAATAAAACSLGTRFVDREASPANLAGVQIANRGLGLFVGAHFYECESTRAASRLIAHHGDRFNRPGACEQLLQLCFADLVGEISDVQLPTHNTDSSVADATLPGTGSGPGWMSSRS